MTGIECGALEERMPDVASGASAWSAEEAAHIERCDSCALEWRLVETARRLGGRAARRIDFEKLASNVIAGVRNRERRSRIRVMQWASGLAAAAVLVVVLRINLQPSRRAAEPPDTALVITAPLTGAIPMAELESLDAEQLESVLEHLDAAVGTSEGGGVPSMGDLDDQQLERVLRSLEG